MDHAPGPIIARVAPKVANMIGIPRLPALEQTIHSSAIATTVPAIGVNAPLAPIAKPEIVADPAFDT